MIMKLENTDTVFLLIKNKFNYLLEYILCNNTSNFKHLNKQIVNHNNFFNAKYDDFDIIYYKLEKLFKISFSNVTFEIDHFINIKTLYHIENLFIEIDFYLLNIFNFKLENVKIANKIFDNFIDEYYNISDINASYNILSNNNIENCKEFKDNIIFFKELEKVLKSLLK